MKKITIKDVAREAGVSVTLVSFVMNAKVGEDGRLDCPVNPETAARVLDVAKRLGYRRNAAAASLRSGRSNTIAVITTDIANNFFAGISRYIEDKSAEYGYTVLFCSSDESAEKLDSLVDTVLAYNIDGLIVAPVPGGRDAIAKAIEAKVPVVLLDRDIEGLDGVGKVLLDDVGAGEIATEYFVGKGYRKIEMVSYDLDISSISERAEGYRKSMAAHGLEARVDTVPYGDPQKLMTSIIKDAIARGVEAFFLPTYSLTAMVFGAMKEMNLRTPRDLGLVAFDESDLYRLGPSTVAHIVQPLRELGEKSVEVLHAMIENEPGETTIILRPELVPGGSVADK
jgi:LacI family transcriptional regulator